ncbi:hypothetical protein EFL69_07675 [Weissella confusa]|uniref:hypothetical protein n=1 Tax=Weissella confusa TaxID=1583 RepID=UPI00223A78E1|nr:hypothetical protein [Weissella confusa]MCS9992956.1 hypothetical protein [Weissella confusa]
MKKQLVALGVIVAISGGVLTAVSLHKEEPQKSVSQKKRHKRVAQKTILIPLDQLLLMLNRLSLVIV